MPSETILARVIGSEDNGEYGVVLTDAAQCIVFETGPEGSLTRWEHVENITTLENAFEAVAVGVSMQRRGLIT